MTREQKVGLGVAGLVGAFLLYRHSSGSGTKTLATPISTQGSIAPSITPQPPVPLESGESVYDPNLGTLYNTPQAGGSPQPAMGQSTTAAGPRYTVNVNYPKVTTMRRTRKKPTKRPVTKKHHKVVKA